VSHSVNPSGPTATDELPRSTDTNARHLSAELLILVGHGRHLDCVKGLRLA
jgi:hypothetical protein